LKRKIAMLLVSATLAIALLGGGVYAYFSDTETSSGNSLTAGSLDLTIGSSGSTKLTLTNLAPGMSGASSIQLTNIGSIGGTLSMLAQHMVDDEGATWEPETGDTSNPGELSANVDIAVFSDADNDGSWDGGEALLWSGKLNALDDASIGLGSLAGSASTYIGIYWSIDSAVGNDIMGDITTFDIEFTLQQT
jgi:spore coat-associated protein N